MPDKSGMYTLTLPEDRIAVFKRLNEEFKKNYSRDADYTCFSPGRLNIIGEHIDYCGGMVMPAAIDMGTYAVAAVNNRKEFRLRSLNFPETGSVSLSGADYQQKDGWLNYPKGIIYLLEKQFPGFAQEGADILLYGTLPVGAGLSSSASLLLAVLSLLKEIYTVRFSDNRLEDMRETAFFAKRTENEYIGLNCGIMDQGSVVFGRKDCLMLMDCSRLNVEYIPFRSGKYSLIIANTNKSRSLADSKYNIRKAESEQALSDVRSKYPLKDLCGLPASENKTALALIKDETVRRRARHILTENNRVFRAKEALTAGDFQTFGQLLNQSHQSLKDDYEVTGKELDSLTDAARKQRGVLGARMTGAGFAGCALIFCETASATEIAAETGVIYHRETGLDAQFFLFSACAGVSALKLKQI